MSWTEKIFAYCERGSDPGFWAEPLNAISNAAFVIAAIVAFSIWRARQRGSSPPGRVELALIILVGVIGVGSFLFHTLATRWAAIADTAPIGVFMLAYLAYAGIRFLQLGVLGTLVLLGLFIAAHPALAAIQVPILRTLGAAIGYVPALVALFGVGAWATLRRQPAGPWLLAGGTLFLLSLTARTLDRQICQATSIGGYTAGTHFLWHLLNAGLLFLLLVAALRHGRRA